VNLAVSDFLVCQEAGSQNGPEYGMAVLSSETGF
jgi:hypothetical protein